MLKRFFACLLTVALLLCTFSFALADDQQTIRVLWWGSQTRHDATTKMIEKFMEKYPNIKVEIEFTDWTGYWSKLATQAAGGLVPDVVQMDYAYLTQYVNSGILADLSSHVESGAMDVSNILDSVLACGKVNNGVYAIPTGTTAPVLMYRKDVLNQAGLTMPIAPTWSEYVELCKKVYDTTGHTSKIAVSLGDLQLAVRNYGLNVYNDEGTALGFDNPAYIVDMWQRYLDAVAYGFQLGVGETTASTPFDEFVADSWTGFHSTNELAAYQKGSGCELEMAAYPSLDDATQAPSYFKPTMFWSVSNDSKVKDAAVTFINFFTNDTACYDIVGIDRGIPVSSVIRDYLAPTLDSTSQKVVTMMDYLGQEGHTSPLMKPNLPVHNEIDALFTSYFEEVQYGTVSDLTAQAQAFMDEANAIIAKSLKSN